MKKSEFPDWVLRNKRPCTTIKKIGNNYYLYYASSLYDPVKKGPKAVQYYIGKISKDGVISDRILIDPGKCQTFKLADLFIDIDDDLKDLDVLKAKNACYLLKCDQKKIDKLIMKGLYEDGKILL